MSNVNELQREMLRRKTNKMTMLRMFKLKHELTTADLIRNFGTGCSSRLHELREDGHIIVTVYMKPGSYRYVYKGREKTE